MTTTEVAPIQIKVRDAIRERLSDAAVIAFNNGAEDVALKIANIILELDDALKHAFERNGVFVTSITIHGAKGKST